MLGAYCREKWVKLLYIRTSYFEMPYFLYKILRFKNPVWNHLWLPHSKECNHVVPLMQWTFKSGLCTMFLKVKLNITSVGKVRQNPHTIEDIKENFDWKFILYAENMHQRLDSWYVCAMNSCGTADSMSSNYYNSAIFPFVMC